jgi:hypothetical protein
MTLLGLGIAIILFALSALHIFWAAGGQWGSRVAVPEVGGRPAFVPSTGATLAVAAALLLAALVVLGRVDLWVAPLPRWLCIWGTWGLAVLFLARAVGDVHRCGFFKQVCGTAFAWWDTRLFSPLCLGLGLGLVWIAWH